MRSVLPLLCLVLSGCASSPGPFTDTFAIDDCTFTSTGDNPFFLLEPGHRLELEGGGDRVWVTVLNETRFVDGVLTRVVEEREWEDGELVEVSRNYFAQCQETRDVYYFGEEVDDYEGGRVTGHGGAWLAGEDGARAGIIMPGTPLLGARYHQEIAPGVAMDRAEVMALDEVRDVPAGHFEGVLRTREGSAIESGTEAKYYARGVGLIQEEHLLLVTFGPA